jgi:hypothetical protein
LIRVNPRRKKVGSASNKKRQGRPPAVFDVESVPLLGAVDYFPQFSPRGKLRDSPGSNFDGGARLWIPSIAGLSLRYREGAKPDQRYPITFLQCTGNAFHSSVDCGTGLCFTDTGASCDAVNEIGFIHRLSWRVSFCPQKVRGRDALPELETRRHYLAPHREESQLWKSWKSAPDAFFRPILNRPASTIAPSGQKNKPFSAPVSGGKRLSKQMNPQENLFRSL